MIKIIKSWYSQRGGDSGRHSWYRWMDGPQPEGSKTTVAMNIFDLVLLKVGFSMD